MNKRSIPPEYLKAAGVLVVLLLLARVAGIDAWVRAALSAFLSIAGVRLGIMASRVDGRRELLVAGVLFGAGAACMAIQLASTSTDVVAHALLTASLVLMVASVVVLHRAQRPRSQGEGREPG